MPLVEFWENHVDYLLASSVVASTELLDLPFEDLHEKVGNVPVMKALTKTVPKELIPYTNVQWNMPSRATFIVSLTNILTL